ncbi:MAG: class II aldolase/adducin family protein [Leucobacter sp.]
MHARDRVLSACGALAAAGQQDMVWGHVAVRDEAGRGVWIKRSGVGYDELTPDDVHLVDWRGDLIEGTGRPHIEVFMHLEIMRARPDAVATVHSHAPAVNAFSALDEPLRAISHAGVLFADPQIPRSRLSGDLIADAERARDLAVELGPHLACLLPRHGFVAAGRSDAEAVMASVLLEAACREYLDARACGEIRSYSDAEEIAQKRAHVWPDSQIEAGYAYLCRR